QTVYASFLGEWQHLVPSRPDGRRDRATWSGHDGLLSVIDQLAGVSLPLSTWESQVLPARLPDYTESLLDAAMASGEVVCSGLGHGAGGGLATGKAVDAAAGDSGGPAHRGDPDRAGRS